jgi:hypothetical protein
VVDLAHETAGTDSRVPQGPDLHNYRHQPGHPAGAAVRRVPLPGLCLTLTHTVMAMVDDAVLAVGTVTAYTGTWPVCWCLYVAFVHLLCKGNPQPKLRKDNR